MVVVTKMYCHYFKFIAVLALLLFTSACAQLGLKSEWGDDLPDRSLFVASYRNDKANQQHQSLDNYLFWVRQYYNGTPLQPEGWLDISRKVIEYVDSDQVDQTADQLHTLGVRIASEWAKNNRVRKIDTGNISAWGVALRTSISRDDVANLITLVNDDIDALLAGKLVSNDIDDERYYRSEYDEFF